MRCEPSNPFRPPRTILARCLCQVSFRIDIVIVRLLSHHLEIVTIMAGLGYDPGIVAAAREQIRNVSLGLKINLVCWPPRRHVVVHGAHCEDWGTNVGE